MHLRRYQPSDWPELLRMSHALFPQEWTAGDEDDLRSTLARSDAAVFVIDRGDGRLGGYVEAGTRSVADGCPTSPVGYIEAWYVDPDLRRSGHGRALMAAAEDWARGQGYREMASDALIDNTVSHRAHEANGYHEVARVVTYRKSLRSRPNSHDL